jgi:hypothetical protein
LQTYSGFTNCILKSSQNISGHLAGVTVGTDKFYTLPEKRRYDKSLNNID